ncbi:Flp pilus assembly protein CpaB [Stenotrophomonas bentonitica]|uniref:Flp pilus assembly protein CpaB n=1 Tax=Stenotrophomonas bentonitica TaxID=1450134 RepID=UPI00345E6ED7
MLKLTRITAVVLIALALLLALAAVAVGRRAPPPMPAATVVAPPATVAAEPEPAASSAALPAQSYAQRLNPGERALAIPVDELVAAGNRILPGDHVDVFLNLRAPPGMNNDGQAQTRLLLSRLRVLSYGAADAAPPVQVADAPAPTSPADSRAADIQGSASGSGGSGGAPQPARSAVLAVPVADANRLLLGAQQGKLFLALRNPADPGLPDATLFARTDAVLDARRDLDPAQRLALASPENDAYAGLDADALAGHVAAPRAPHAPHPARHRATARVDRGVEIIRGDASSYTGAH